MGRIMWNFILTEVCNWNCDYCVFPKKENPQHATKLNIEAHIDYIKDIMNKTDPGIQNLMIQGGEIGLVPEDVLVYLFKRTERTIDVSTNGEFVRRKYHQHSDIRPWVNRIMLHITEPIDEYKINLDYDITDDKIFMDIGICDVNKDPEKTRMLIISNPEIRFDFVDYEHSVFGNPCRVNSSVYKDLYESIQDLDNVTDFAKERLWKRYIRHKDTNIEKQQQICRTLHPSVFIDFVNETIPLCVRNYGLVYLPLTKDNLIKVISSMAPFDYTNHTCDNCFRICQNGGANMDQIHTKLNFKKILKV